MSVFYRNDLLRARRAQLDLSLAAASKKSKLSINTIVKLEAGTDPKTSTLIKIAIALEMNPEDLLKGLASKSKKPSLDLPLFDRQPHKAVLPKN